MGLSINDFKQLLSKILFPNYLGSSFYVQMEEVDLLGNDLFIEAGGVRIERI
jgi:hypothetical protein